MACSSMVSVAAFCPGYPSWFAVSNSNEKLLVFYSIKYCNPIMGGTYVGGDK